jgi:uncharacterized membrane protein HdeD (DUF308 family)
MNTPFLPLLARNWGWLFLRGLFAVAFGFVAFVYPGPTLVALVLLYGVYAAADGILALIAAFSGSRAGSRGWLIFEGIVSLAAAGFAFFYTGFTTLLLLLLVGWWSIARGIAVIVGAIRVRKEIDNEWWLILSGVLSLVFGLFVLFQPSVGALAVAWTVASYSLAAGILLIGFSFRLRRHQTAARFGTANAHG